jgi:antitoxin component of MazEF toxin-antitoxin module
LTFNRIIRKRGDHYILDLPEELVTALELELGSEVNLSIKDNQLITTKIKPFKPIYNP